MLNLTHVGLHGRINQNAGDTLLFEATRKCFEHFLGKINWDLHQLWDPFNADIANKFDGVIVGGGGLLLPDQEGASYAASGWQWNCTVADLDALKTPLIVFAIGYNRFRGQEELSDVFHRHFSKFVNDADFISFREQGWHLKPEDSLYQPCPTTCLWQLYPDLCGTKTSGKVLGLNVAMDRAEYRFGDKIHEVLNNVMRFADYAHRQGYRVQVMNHKPGDRAIEPYLSAHGIPCVSRELWNKPPKEIIYAYQDVGVVAGMRGHAQLIPFGMRKPIISMISHDKLKWFLDDIGHPEWGVEVLDASFLDKMCELLEAVTHPPVPVHITEAQDGCWQITEHNMERIGDILGKD